MNLCRNYRISLFEQNGKKIMRKTQFFCSDRKLLFAASASIGGKSSRKSEWATKSS